MEPRGHQIIARTLRARSGQDGGLELEETPLLHPAPQRINDLPAFHDVVVEVLATQVEETVLKPYILGIIMLAEDRHRELASRSQHLHPADEQFDPAGRQVPVLAPAGSPFPP